MEGISWQSSGLDSVLSLLRAQVQSLARELRSHKPHGVSKKRKKKVEVRAQIAWGVGTDSKVNSKGGQETKDYGKGL